MNYATECTTLAERYKAKREAGLIAVKFLLRNDQEALKEEICAEVNRLDDALERGDWVNLVFNDRHLQKTHGGAVEGFTGRAAHASA
jgi:hypothetical protein